MKIVKVIKHKRAFNSPLQRRLRHHMIAHLALKVAVTALRSEIFDDISGYLAQVGKNGYRRKHFPHAISKRKLILWKD